MSQDLPVQEGRAGGVVLAAGEAETQVRETAMPYRALHQLLRGRYPTVLGAGVLLGLAGAALGWKATHPLYQSEALVRISPNIPRLGNSDDYRPMEVFEAYMQSQKALIASHRVVSDALRDSSWAKSGISIGKTSVDEFAEGLMVEHKPGTEHLRITYTGTDRRFTSVAANAVLASYVRYYDSVDRDSAKDRVAALEQQRKQQKDRLAQIETELRTAAQDYGTTNLDRLYDSVVGQLSKVESYEMDVRIAIALAEAAEKLHGKGAVTLNAHDIARVDPTMARYMAQREDLENQLATLRMRYGEGHSQVQQTKKALDVVVSRISAYAVEVQASPVAATIASSSTGQVSFIGKSLAELQTYQQKLAALDQQARVQVAAVGGRKLKLDAMKADMDKLRADLGETTQRLMLLQAESGLGGRMAIMSTAEMPLQPMKDRRPQSAAAGGIIGMALPAVLVATVTAARRRYRFSEDATDRDIPLLGILPQLPARLSDPDCAADAAQCVHQIRVMMQVQAQGRGAMAYLMTSACPGEGKTSLTAALALSYAAAGAKTVIVDADLIGQRMTHGYRLEEKAGFREMISSSRSMHVYPTGLANLEIIPAGVSDGRDACAVSNGQVRRMLAELRQRYDVVLVDSGPILGSLEALVMAGQADAVVLTISREQQKPLVDRAVRQLKSVGAQIAGMVFNKAQSWDFRRSVSMSSLRSVARNPEGGLVRVGMTSTSGFGSLVDSVQTYMPSGV